MLRFRGMIKDTIQRIVRNVLSDLYEISLVETEILVDRTSHRQFGDYSTNVAFSLAKILKTSPQEVADKLTQKINNSDHEELEKAEAVGGYINFFINEDFLREQFSVISEQDDYGLNKKLAGQTIMVEFTDPNPFKLFHIGHLMSNTIGEAIARLYEASGAKVIRANYQGDVGIHVAKTIWGMKNHPDAKNGKKYMPTQEDSLGKKVEYLGQMYAYGSSAYESFTEQIGDINKKIYDRSDSEVNKLYDLGKKWSLEYFEEIYKKLGTKFEHYFFESETGKDGLELVKTHSEMFTESQGAIIFEGEKYGLHTRVFVNSQGLPTYEAKELGLNKKKFELFPGLDLSVVVTGNEIIDYFKVELKVMELIIPEVAQKTRHVPHGMLRLPTGKMSSRTGDVITAESLIDDVKSRVKVKTSEDSLASKDFEDNLEQIAIGAIKYSILKQSPGKDIIFDIDKSLSIEGDSGPYIQYTYARLKSILSKAGEFKKSDYKNLIEESELNLMKKLLEFPEIIESSGENINPNRLTLYLFELAGLANNFYEKVRILNDDNQDRIADRLKLVETVANILKKGLDILGIKTLERI